MYISFYNHAIMMKPQMKVPTQSIEKNHWLGQCCIILLWIKYFDTKAIIYIKGVFFKSFSQLVMPFISAMSLRAPMTLADQSDTRPPASLPVESRVEFTSWWTLSRFAGLGQNKMNRWIRVTASIPCVEARACPCLTVSGLSGWHQRKRAIERDREWEREREV